MTEASNLGAGVGGESETRDGRRARFFKGEIMSALEEVVELMEQARSEGFLTEFSVSADPATGKYSLPQGGVTIVKRW